MITLSPCSNGFRKWVPRRHADRFSFMHGTFSQKRGMITGERYCTREDDKRFDKLDLTGSLCSLKFRARFGRPDRRRYFGSFARLFVVVDTSTLHRHKSATLHFSLSLPLVCSLRTSQITVRPRTGSPATRVCDII